MSDPPGSYVWRGSQCPPPDEWETEEPAPGSEEEKDMNSVSSVDLCIALDRFIMWAEALKQVVYSMNPEVKFTLSAEHIEKNEKAIERALASRRRSK